MKSGLRRLRAARAVLLATVALLVVSGLWIASRASTPTDGAPILTDGGYPKGFTVDPLSSDPTPLRSGDVITGVEGSSVNDLLTGGRADLPPLRAGTAWRYDVRRDGETRSITVGYRDGGFVMERLRAGASVLLLGLSLIAFGGWAVLSRPEHPAARALLLLGGGFTSYQLFQLLSPTMAELARARPLFALGVAGHVGSLAIWTTAAAHLALSFPEPVRLLSRRARVPAAAYLLMLAGTGGLQGGAIASGHAGLRTIDGFYTGMEGALYALTIATFAGLVRTIGRAIRDPSARRQGALVALGMATTLLILTWGNTFARDQRQPAWFAVAAFVPLPAALAVAIVRGEFLDLRATINRALVFVTLTGSLLAIYALTVVTLGAIVGNSGLAATVPATGIVAIALAPLRSTLQRGVDRVIYGGRSDAARVLAELGRRLDDALPADELLAVVAETVATSLRLPYVAIQTSTTAGADALACERGERGDHVEEFALMRQANTVGHLIVGTRRGQRHLTRDDRALLTDVGRQVAIAVDASRLLTELTASQTKIAVAREHERAQLRHDLHDRLGSQLTGLRLQLDTLETRTADAALARDAHKASEEAQRALDEVRRISRGLRPAELDGLGLRAAVASAAERMSVGDGDWTATIDAALHLPPIPKPVSSAAYHVVVEALTNARRHSGGTEAHVRIGVTADGTRLVLEVTDNGNGINGEPREGVGLQSMRERTAAVGGEFELNAGADGTSIRAQLPLEGTNDSAAL